MGFPHIALAFAGAALYVAALYPKNGFILTGEGMYGAGT
jgi:hypothetical protein